MLCWQPSFNCIVSDKSDFNICIFKQFCNEPRLFSNVREFCPFYFLVVLFLVSLAIDFVEDRGVVFVVNQDLLYVIIFFLLVFVGQLLHACSPKPRGDILGTFLVTC